MGENEAAESADTLMTLFEGPDMAEGNELARIPVERVTAVDGDGWIYDVDTGEVIAHSTDDHQRFEIVSQDAANWVMSLRFNAEATKLAIEARRAAYNANCDKLVRDIDNRLAWWDFRFRTDLINFARSQLTAKAKTFKSFFGSVSFRAASKGRREIVSMEEAVEAVKRWKPELVKRVETVKLTDLDACQVTAIEVQGEPDDFAGFMKTIPGEESITITTGVELGSSKGNRK
jgi:hypothetical protein